MMMGYRVDDEFVTVSIVTVYMKVQSRSRHKHTVWLWDTELPGIDGISSSLSYQNTCAMYRHIWKNIRVVVIEHRLDE